MDCLACAQCIDACDEVMDRLGQPRGLIRYDSQQGLAGKKRRVLRPRVFIYAALGALGLLVATVSLAKHEPFEANVLRVQGPPYSLDGDMVRNAFRVHLVNKEPQASTFHLRPETRANVTFNSPIQDVRLESLASADIPIFVTIPRSAFAGQIELTVQVRDDAGASRTLKVPFLGPSLGAAASGVR
jgi:polyferredoxin